MFVLPCFFFALQSCSEYLPPDEGIVWGLKLQIGDYILDSIFSNEDISDSRFGLHGDSDEEYYRVNMDKIETKVPNYAEAFYTGKIYGWDTDCFRDVYFMSRRGKVVSSPDFYFEVDSDGKFNFSEIAEHYTELSGVQFWIRPRVLQGKACYPKNNPILVHFSL